MSYEIKFSRRAARAMRKLPNKVQAEVLTTHLPKIASAPRDVGFSLRGKLKGEWSYHFGHHPEYRILYLIDDDEQLITVTTIGSREEIYKRAKR